MKVLVIPDVHLKPEMFEKAALLLERGAAQRAVCLMDIPDNWNQEYNLELYQKTFDAAIAFAVQYPDTLWVYGNHDLCYLWNERESGYSEAAAGLVRKKLGELSLALQKGNEIRYIQKIDHVLFCHGGLTDWFVKHTVRFSYYDDVEKVVQSINELSRQYMWSEVSPIWHRPQYSEERMYKPYDLLQVVGHTPMEKIEKIDNLISCDVFSTYRDGSPIGTQEFPVIDTKTWEFCGMVEK